MTKGDFIGLATILLIGAFIFFLFTPNANEARKMREAIQQRKEYLSALEEEARETRHTIELLKNDDPAAIEAVARDKFGYTREGEEIYQVEKTTPAAGEGGAVQENPAE